jgi:diguanylate cyclase (GGDEF)-like protein/hemerythrin-like metal-binding protein
MLNAKDGNRSVVLPSGTQFMYVLGLLVDGSSALVGLKDLAGHYVFANRELESIFHAPPGGLVGLTNGDVMEAADASAHDARDFDVAASGQPAHSIDEYAVDGRRIAYATVRFPYRDEDTRIMGTGFVAIDVSERVRTPPGERAALDRALHTIDALRRAVDEMQRQATTDRLTGAATRVRIEEAARQESLRLARYGHPVSLIFADLDRFKRVNDTYGHAAGDAVLREFCAVTRQGMRATDLLGRWGGEEFVVLLPNTGVTSARLAAERIRCAIAERDFAHAGSVTASFGVAELQPDETLASWTARADAAMYRAKDGGRNRVVADVPANPDAIGIDSGDAGFLRLTWCTPYECGDETIDRGHRRLFDDANRVLAALIGRRPKDEVTPLLDDLVAHVATHFRDEERIYREAGYPEADRHTRMHARLLARAGRLVGQHRSGRLAASELTEFLVNAVVARHLLVEDRKFFPYLQVKRGG